MPRTVCFLFLGAALLMCGTAGMIAQEKTPEPAQTIIDAAVMKAKAQNKTVFVHLSASW